MPLRLGLTAALLSVAIVVSGARAANQTVQATSSNTFSPASVSINQGETVTWVNAGGSHNVRFDDGGFEVPADPATTWPATVARTFNTPGTYTYLCEQHSGMTGTVVVNPSGGPGPGTPPPGGTPPGGEPPNDPGPGGPDPGGPGPSLPLLKVTLKVSDRTPLFGSPIKLSGAVRPARDGRKVKIQRRGANGAYKTIATARLRDGGAAKSVFSLRLKLKGDAVLRARVAGDDERGAGVSKTRAIDVRRPVG